MNKNPSLIERLAGLEHEQWLHWMREIVTSEAISMERKKRWFKCDRRYGRLTEKEKEQDREWARRVINILEDEIAPLKRKIKCQRKELRAVNKRYMMWQRIANGDAADRALAWKKYSELKKERDEAYETGMWHGLRGTWAWALLTCFAIIMLWKLF